MDIHAQLGLYSTARMFSKQLHLESSCDIILDINVQLRISDGGTVVAIAIIPLPVTLHVLNFLLHIHFIE